MTVARTDLTIMDRVRVYAAVSSTVTIDKKTAQYLCALADMGVKAHNLDQREAQIQKKANELLAQAKLLEKEIEDFALVRLISFVCLGLGVFSALVGVLL